MFKILSESGIAAGIRRIEAVTGFGVHEHLLTQEQLINTIAQQLKTSPSDIQMRVENLLSRIKEQEKEIDQLRSRVAANSISTLMESKKTIGPVNYIVSQVDGLDIRTCNMVDNLKDRIGPGLSCWLR